MSVDSTFVPLVKDVNQPLNVYPSLVGVGRVNVSVLIL